MDCSARRFLDTVADADLLARCRGLDRVDAITSVLTWRRARRARPTEAALERVHACVGDAVRSDAPIRLIDAFGGFKSHRVESGPRAGWAEVFHLAFMRRWLLPIAAIHPPGFVLEYCGQGEVATLVDNIRPEDVRTYDESFRALVRETSRTLPTNVRVVVRGLGEFHDLEDLRARFAEWDASTISPESLPTIDALLDRARNNFDWHGAVEFGDPDEDRRRDVLRRSVWKLEQWYRFDSERRRAAFEGGIVITHGFGGGDDASPVRSVAGSDKAFWMTEGVLEPAGDGFRPTLLMPDDPRLGMLERASCAVEPGGPIDGFDAVPLVRDAAG